jgi:hypothetical protein
MSTPPCRWALAACLLATCAGCGSGERPRYHVTGNVTAGGKPVPAGVMFFEPDALAGNDGQPGYAYIKAGKFDTRDQGQPTIGGKHQVRIQAFDGKPGDELPLGRMIAPESTTPVDLAKADSQQDFVVPLPGQPIE